MTCRIERLPSAEGIVVHISGRITRDSLDILRTVLADGGVVAVDLAELELTDRDAVNLLAMHEANGIELRHCPAYIREWITREWDSN